MTNRAMFSDVEWDLLVRLPRLVVTAASAAQADGARRTAAEDEAGLIAIANGRQLGNPFVEDIASRLMEVFDDPGEGSTAAAIDFADTEAGIASVLERAQTATRLLAAKAESADASAYLHWLLTITDLVVGASRSGDVLGIGGDAVTDPERRFRDRLAHIVRD